MTATDEPRFLDSDGREARNRSAALLGVPDAHVQRFRPLRLLPRTRSDPRHAGWGSLMNEQPADLVADGVPRIVEPPSDVVAKPPTIKQRNRWTQNGLGYRPTNEWNSGDLPAPYAEGDLLWLPEGAENERMRGMTGGRYFSIVYATSIDEGDAWYFRVTDSATAPNSDRLHVAWAARSSFHDDVNWMEDFQLVETADPLGLDQRERMLAEGFDFPRAPDLDTATELLRRHVIDWGRCDHPEECDCSDAEARRFLGLVDRPTSAPAATPGRSRHDDGSPS